MSTTNPTPKPVSLAALLGQRETFEQVNVRLPPIRPSATPTTRLANASDLRKMARVWALIGRGGSGKTTLARLLLSHMAERNLIGSTLVAALDPTNRSLAEFYEGVAQPPSQNTEESERFLRDLVQFAASNQMHGVWDFGGGDVTLARLIDDSPDFDRLMADNGTALVAAYVFSPAVDDIATLRSFEERRFQPKATALILNLGKAASPSAFDALRSQDAYKAALDRGAIEIMLPKLYPENLALSIERKRLQFFEARDGTVPAGSSVRPIEGLEAGMVRNWLTRCDDVLKPIATWLPWN